MSGKRNNNIYIEDIWESISKIEAYVSEITEREFETSTEKQDAVIRRLEIIGEAVKHLSEEFRNNHIDVQWRQIAGIRDIVIHEYFGVSIGLIWKVSTSDIPLLKEKIKSIRQQLKK